MESPKCTAIRGARDKKRERERKIEEEREEGRHGGCVERSEEEMGAEGVF